MVTEAELIQEIYIENSVERWDRHAKTSGIRMCAKDTALRKCAKKCDKK